MKTSLFDYYLPQSAIATYPVKVRDSSRLQLCEIGTLVPCDRYFFQLPEILRAGDLLLLNNSFVRSSRLRGKKLTGGRLELLVTAICDTRHALVMVKSNRSCVTGTQCIISAQYPDQAIFNQNQIEPVVISFLEKRGILWFVHFSASVMDVVARYGKMPLPPYIKRCAEAHDKERYQTVYADVTRAESVAAPTAGLHFTHSLLERLQQHGIGHAFLTLHIGVGTFKPVQTSDIEVHTMHTERYSVNTATVKAISDTKAAGGRVIAVGTSSLRCIEALMATYGTLQAAEDTTDVFIYPPYTFQIIDGLLTNFHTPKSTLLMLVCAFVQHKQGGTVSDALRYTLAAYKQALDAGYRFFSYGDAQLLI